MLEPTRASASRSRDGSPHFPSLRDYTPLAGTGRGLQLLDDFVDAWGVFAEGDGKVVWFEIADRRARSPPPIGSPEPAATGTTRPRPLAIELRNVPLLMHAAWQEHAAALLRDFLLVQLDDEPDALERHARASDALNVLHTQLPAPDLGDDPGALMATAIEPGVSLASRRARRTPQLGGELPDPRRPAGPGGRGGGRRACCWSPAPSPRSRRCAPGCATRSATSPSGPAEPVPWVARTDIWQPMTTVDYDDWDSAGGVRVPGARCWPPTRRASSSRSAASALRVPGFRRRDRAGRPTGHHDHPVAVPPGPHRRHDAARGQRPSAAAGGPGHRARAAGRRDRDDRPSSSIEPRRRSAGRKVFIAEFFPLAERAAG